MEEIIANSTAQSTQGQSLKVSIAITLITALTTIGVAVIGVFPQLRNKDGVTISDLREKLNDLERRAGPMTKDNASALPDKKLRVDGHVKSEDGKRPMREVEVYLLPDGRGIPTAKTDVNGKFRFDDVPDGQYSILVRDSSNGKSNKLLLDEEDEVTLEGARIKYHVQK